MLIHTCDAVPMPFPCLACRGLGICALAFRGIAECIVQLGTRSTTVLMLTYNFTPQEASKYSLGGLQAPARACVCVCVCECVWVWVSYLLTYLLHGAESFLRS